MGDGMEFRSTSTVDRETDFVVTGLLMAAGLMAIAVNSPEYLTAAFNPVTLNVAMIALSAIALLSGRNLPSAARCQEQKREPNPRAALLPR